MTTKAEDEDAQLMKVADAAALLAVSEPMVRKLITMGKLTAVRFVGNVRVRRKEVLALANGEQVQVAAANPASPKWRPA